MRLGVHASLRMGFPAALEKAAQLGCEAVQIFPRRPLDPLRLPSEIEAAEFRDSRRRLRIGSVAVHALFQPNLASSNPSVRERSLRSLAEEYEVASLLEADFFVVHAGSYSPGATPGKGIAWSAGCIRRLLDGRKSATRVLIENMAGGGRRLTGNLEELRALFEEVGRPERTGFCLDTAHAYGAGEAIQTIAGLEDWLGRCDGILGLSRVFLFHTNETQADLGSHKDIHSHPGEGKIGLESLRRLVKMDRFGDVPGILEVPPDRAGSDAEDLALLRQGS